MKFLVNFLFSTRLTTVLLFVFAYAIGAATFIENEFDTTTARIEIFRSKWLELILVLLMINFLGNIKKYNMISEKKWQSLVFHLAFVVIIIGAGVTRYFGYEGMMPIREGQTTNVMYTAEPYLNIQVTNPLGSQTDTNTTLGYSQPKLMAATTNNDFSIPFNFKEESVEISYVDYIKNAHYKIYENIKDGKDLLKVVTTVGGQRQDIFIESGKSEKVGTVLVSFNNPSIKGAVSVVEKGDSFLIFSPYKIPRMVMATQAVDTVEPNVVAPMYFRQLHTINGNSVVFAERLKNAVKNLESSDKDTPEGDALKLKVKIGDDVKEEVLFGGPGRIGNPNYFSLMGYLIQASYGAKPIELPFSIRLDDFIFERYPGSDNPSGYKSEVTLYDESVALTERHSIFMNNVLDYKGFRFFQSSFDPDEKGTRLSVNFDTAGTNITYIGYLLLGIGFLLSCTNKNSRFVGLMKRVKDLRKKRMALSIIAVLFTLSVSANDDHNHDGHNHAAGEHKHSEEENVISEDHSGHNHAAGNHNHGEVEDSNAPLGGAVDNGAKRIPLEHADKFGKLLVQSRDGRFEPINTLALDVLHKISKKDEIEIEGLGVFSPEQFLLELIVNGKLFEAERIIYVSDDSLQSYLGITEGKYASFMDFFRGKGDSKIRKFAQEATQKDPAKRNRWDKEIIKVGDKMETFYRAQRGELLTIFPTLDSTKNNKWISIYDEESVKSLVGTLETKGQSLDLTHYSYVKLLSQYFIFLRKGDYSSADGMLSLIDQIQRKYTPEGFLPSPSKIDLEIDYNNSGIFGNIQKIYSILSVFLIVFAFIEIMASRNDKGLLSIIPKHALLFIFCAGLVTRIITLVVVIKGAWVYALWIVLGVLISILIEKYLAKDKKTLKKVVSFLLKIGIAIYLLTFLYHTYGLGVRWYLTDHAPWSNGYEALVFIAWGAGLAGLLFARYSKLTTAGTSFVAFLILMTASHENMDPQLTNLVPVLKSYWLVIHVACITTSYGFFGLGAILGLIVLATLVFKTKSNSRKINLLTSELTFINEMTITIGVMLAAVGTFLGGIWANESWGRYWGWDAKETWALVIVIVYAMLLHFRFVPGFIRSKFFFNAFGTIAGFGAVCMTFFGVNFYFSKSIHSYAAGDPPAFPIWLWVVLFLIFTLTIVAGIRDFMVDKRGEKK